VISDHSIFESLASLGMKGEARANSFLFREIFVTLVTVAQSGLSQNLSKCLSNLAPAVLI